jgi:hypothetical protein
LRPASQWRVRAGLSPASQNAPCCFRGAPATSGDSAYAARRNRDSISFANKGSSANGASFALC